MPRPERPVDPTEGVVERFAVELRSLRTAGGLTYRKLAKSTGYAVSTLSDAAGGRQLPTLDVTLAFVEACGGDAGEWETRWHAAAAGAAAQRSALRDQASERAPYRGLSSFAADDADLFFGRDRLVAELLDRVTAARVTVVLGASGVGKSSLLAAGLVPALREGGTYRPVVVTPGTHPCQNLRDALGEPPAGDPLCVVVDQFEELFTLCADDERDRFVDALLDLDEPCRVVVGVRADFYARCAENPRLADALRASQVLVGPMRPDELQEAVSRPAAAVGLSVERALLATVVHEAEGRAGALPLLSHAMLETWRTRRGDVLTLAGFQAAGGVSGALVQTAEVLYGSLTPEHQRLAAELLLRMVTVDEDTAATRRRVSLAELLDVDPDAPSVISHLADARLVTVAEDTAEIAHEALLAAWPRLRQWVDDDRDALRLHRKITDAARIWTESDRDASALATGARLELMRVHADSGSGRLRLSAVEREFVDASVRQRRQREAAARRRTNRLRALAVTATAFAVVAGILAGVTGKARVDALDARDTALSRQVALTADRLRGTDPALAAQLSVTGYGIADTSEARSALVESSAVPPPTRYLGGAGPTALAAADDGDLMAVSNAVDGTVRLLALTGGQLTRVATLPPSGPDVQVYALALSPDESLLAVGGTDAGITLWDVTDPREPRRLGSPVRAGAGPVERLDVDPSGTQLAAAGPRGVTRWDIGDPAQPRGLESLPSDRAARTVTFSRDGDRLAFGTDAGDVHVWDVAGRARAVDVLPAGDHTVPAVSFSPDGHTLVAGSHDRKLRRWDLRAANPRRSVELLPEVFDQRVTTTAFSPSGDYLIAGSSDATLRVLDTSTWRTVLTLPHPDVVTWATFTDRGRSVVSVATDGTVRVWNLIANLPQRGGGPVSDVPFTADGRQLAVFAEAGASLWDSTDPARPWPVNDQVAAAPRGQPFSGAGDISPDGRLVAAGTVTGGVQLVDVSKPVRPSVLDVLSGTREEVVAVAFSPDGSMLAAGGRDSAIRVWDVSTPSRPRLVSTLRDPRDVVLDLEWHPKGRYLTAASADSRTYVFDMRGDATPKRLGGLESYAYSATFSPDGTTLAVGGVDSEVLLWDTSDPGSPKRLGEPVRGPAGRIFELSFDPSGDLLAGSVIDGTTWLWDVADRENPTRAAVLSAGGTPLNATAFRPSGGDMLVAGGADGRLQSWRTDPDSVITALCRQVGDPITEREWSTYLHDLPYDPPCRQDGTPA